MSDIMEPIFRKKASLDLFHGLREDLHRLGISGEVEKEILASVLRRINDYLDAEGIRRLAISGIPEAKIKA